MASDLKFRFSLDKFINALVYFASKGLTDLTKLKAVKLLYLADQFHLLRHGRPITGDRYIAMDLGPVPEGAFQLISRMMEPAEVDDPSREEALRRLKVYKGFLNRYKYPILLARTSPDLDVFSDSEIDALEATLAEYGKRPARALVDLTHLHHAYLAADAERAPGSSVNLPYEYFFQDAPADQEHLRALTECQQEDRDFADSLQRAGREAVIRKKAAVAQ